MQRGNGYGTGRGRGGGSGQSYGSMLQQLNTVVTRPALKRKEPTRVVQSNVPLKLLRNDSASSLHFSSPSPVSGLSQSPKPQLQRMPSFGSISMNSSTNEDFIDERIEQHRSRSAQSKQKQGGEPNFDDAIYNEIMSTMALPGFPSQSASASAFSSSTQLPSPKMPSFSNAPPSSSKLLAPSTNDRANLFQKREDEKGFSVGFVLTIVVQTTASLDQTLCSGSVRSSHDQILNHPANYDNFQQFNAEYLFIPYAQALEWVACFVTDKPIWHFVRNNQSLGFLDVYCLKQTSQIKLKRKGERLSEQSRKYTADGDLLRVRCSPRNQSVLVAELGTLSTNSLSSSLLHKDVNPTVYKSLGNVPAVDETKITKLASARLDLLLVLDRILNDKKLTENERDNFVKKTLKTCEVPSICLYGSDDDVLSFWLLRVFFSHYAEFTSECRHVRATLEKMKQVASKDSSSSSSSSSCSSSDDASSLDIDVTTPMEKLSIHKIEIDTNQPNSAATEMVYHKKTESLCRELISSESLLSSGVVTKVMDWWLGMESKLMALRLMHQMTRVQRREFLFSLLSKDPAVQADSLKTRMPTTIIGPEHIVWQAIRDVPQAVHSKASNVLGRLSYDEWFMLLEKDPVLVGLRPVQPVEGVSDNDQWRSNAVLTIRYTAENEEVVRYFAAPLVYVYADYFQRPSFMKFTIDRRFTLSDSPWSLLTALCNSPELKNSGEDGVASSAVSSGDGSVYQSSTKVLKTEEPTLQLEDDLDLMYTRSLSMPSLSLSRSSSLPSSNPLMPRSVSDQTSMVPTNPLVVTASYGFVEIPSSDLVFSQWVPMEMLLSAFEPEVQERVARRTMSRGFALVHDADIVPMIVSQFRTDMNKQLYHLLSYPAPLDSLLLQGLRPLSTVLESDGPFVALDPRVSNTARHSRSDKPDVLMNLPDIEDIDKLLPACLRSLHTDARNGGLKYEMRVIHIKEMFGLHYTAFDVESFYSPGYEHKHEVKDWNTIKTNIRNISEKSLTPAGCGTMQKHGLCPYKNKKQKEPSKQQEDELTRIGRECYAHTGAMFTGKVLPVVKHPHMFIRIAYESSMKQTKAAATPTPSQKKEQDLARNPPPTAIQALQGTATNSKKSLICGLCKRPASKLTTVKDVSVGPCCDGFDAVFFS